MLGMWNNEGQFIVLYTFSLSLFRVMIVILMYIPNGMEFEDFFRIRVLSYVFNIRMTSRFKFVLLLGAIIFVDVIR
jgi:hypothetical protein